MGRDFNRAAREAQNYRIASENASDGLVVQAMDGKIIWVNPAYCHMMGRPAHQMIGRHPFSFAIPQAERRNAKDEQAFRFDARTIETDSLSLHRNQRGDGSLFWNQINTLHHIAPDGTETIILVCRDVTEQIIKEKKLKDTQVMLRVTLSSNTWSRNCNPSCAKAILLRALAAMNLLSPAPVYATQAKC